VAAAAGYSVLLADLESEYLEKARATIAGHLEREVVKGKRPAKERTAALALLMKMVDAGWLGKKTGRGFYEY